MATATKTRPASSASGTTPPPGGAAAGYGPPRPRRSGGPMQRSRPPARTGGRTQQGSQPAPARPAARAAAAPASRTRRAPNLGRTAQQLTAPKFGNYQGIILAEFVLAELLTAATPIVASKQDASSGQYMSPYAGQDMIKMLSIGLVYFLLALVSTGGGIAGRLSAWFGGLILLVVGLNEGTNIAKVLGIFSGLAAAGAGATGTSSGTPGPAGTLGRTLGQAAQNAANAIANSVKGNTSG